MVDDLTEKTQSARSSLEDLIAKVPGVGAYQEKEKRRDADKLLRLHVARRLEEQLARVNEVQYQLTSQGRLDVTLLLERASTKLQLLIDRIKTASYGYAGFFDAIKVDEDALDKLYRFDERMLDASDELEITVGRLVEAIQGEEPIIEQANGLIRQLENLNDTYSKRQDVLLA
ncbi:MAG: hypothetical protein GX649_04225 [Chloroflexi bacterium]|nr:hypothetical protein [Chloroflexota bacterium]